MREREKRKKEGFYAREEGRKGRSMCEKILRMEVMKTQNKLGKTRDEVVKWLNSLG